MRQTVDDIRAIIRRVLEAEPMAGIRKIREAGARGAQVHLQELLAELRAEMGIGMPSGRPDVVIGLREAVGTPVATPEPSSPPAPPIDPNDLYEPASAGWHRLQELLEAARGCEAAHEYQRSLEALVAARDLLTGMGPLNVPGKGMIPRAMTDQERLQLLMDVITRIGRLETQRAQIDVMEQRQHVVFMRAFLTAIREELSDQPELAQRLYGRLKREIMDRTGRPLPPEAARQLPATGSPP